MEGKNHLKALGSLIMTAMLTLPSIAGHAVGNGGDYIRATFMQMGQTVTQYLETTSQGQALVQAHGLDLQKLRDSLTIQKIKVVDEELTDNGGSVVDAIGAPGAITLTKENWFDHFEKQRDIYYLVFHEMLRENGVDDDDYKISSALFPFDAAFALNSRLIDLVPLVQDELLDGVIDQKSISLAGTGCPKGEVTRIDFDSEKNILEINFKGYRAAVDAGKKFDRKNCAMALPFVVPAGKKLVIAQQDLAAKLRLSVGAQGKLSSEVFMAGMVKPAMTKEYKATSSAITGRTLLRKTELLESACGGSGILRANTSGLVNGNEGDMIKVNQLRLYLALEDCTN